MVGSLTGKRLAENRSEWLEPTRNIKYYNMHLPNGKILENMMFRYIGQDNPQDAWLGDYVGYNLNLVTFDMTVIPPQGGQGGQSSG
ncbi:hypothetical protein I317_06547 [Kwoniella heveanensis CBS 569]|uniref:Uncharacterized protein n=1 Tax=Kwoniella heveanensis BCC8398 TaxID=1296120 RepID=A0A1B9GPM1_9TREE|nr:hypothetical protein I316_05294 [Kwoniella heveanensis BCC8398]OCF39637.1 hypothetical protein I317_06547 [Kwoniella heveanensis CBS 569]